MMRVSPPEQKLYYHQIMHMLFLLLLLRYLHCITECLIRSSSGVLDRWLTWGELADSGYAAGQRQLLVGGLLQVYPGYSYYAYTLPLLLPTIY